MKKTFYSNGKLLITGEYLVLDGANSLALPTIFGQDLSIEPNFNNEFVWTSYDVDKSIWFDEKIPFSEIINSTPLENESIKNTLVAILREAHSLNPNTINSSTGFNVTTRLSFDRKWGLGTSSTLINNIAKWFDINAFTLLQNSFGGSGYDIACAQNDCPITYRLEDGKPMVEKVHFNPIFSSHIYFVYLNHKQSSKKAIAAYKEKKGELKIQMNIINQLTETILNAKDLNTFIQAVEKHENEMSTILNTQTVKDAFFNDFNGAIKSLGAWGGDFIMVISNKNPSSYFIEKGFKTIIPYNEMILSY